MPHHQVIAKNESSCNLWNSICEDMMTDMLSVFMPFAIRAMKKIVEKQDFTVTTCNSQHPQSNGQSKHAVQKVNKLLKKEEM